MGKIKYVLLQRDSPQIQGYKNNKYINMYYEKTKQMQDVITIVIIKKTDL